MRAHWDDIYADRRAESLAWHQPVPATLPYVVAHADIGDSIVDVGGGASTLTGHLLERGYHDLTVVDLSKRALDEARQALAGRARQVTWIEADVLAWTPLRRWALWHDRAVFHFLTDPAQRRRYVEVASRSLEVGGVLVVATFAPDGPERCAGLPVCRYDVESLAAEFAPTFTRLEGANLPAVDDGGDQRPYVVVVLTRASD